MKKTGGIKRKYGGVRASERVEERRVKLLAAGLEAFGTKGYTRSGIKEICALAGLTERYFYESFKNKEDLLSRVYNDLVEEIMVEAMGRLDRPAHSSREAVMGMIRFFFETLKDDPRKARMLYFEILGVSDRIEREYLSATFRLIEIIALALERAFPGADREILKKSILPTSLAGALNHIIVRWTLSDFSTPMEEILGQIAFFLEAAEGFFGKDLDGWPKMASPV